MFTESLFDELEKIAESRSDHNDRRMFSSLGNVILPPFGSIMAAKGKKTRSLLGSLGGGVVGAGLGGAAGAGLGALTGGPAGAVLGGMSGLSVGGPVGSGVGSYLAHGKYKGKKED
jgi:hypothetical protein